jgi:hypothetical protein
MEPQAEPPVTLSDPHELLAGYLDYYRAVIVRKLEGMSEKELRGSRLPSGWTPLGPLKHLTYVERRWLRWGFMAEPMDNPWGPSGPGSDWIVGPDETLETLLAAFREESDRSRAIVAAAQLTDRARSGGRFKPPDEHPTLIWILFHVLQEYARHAGHLDIVRELADGSTGE